MAGDWTAIEHATIGKPEIGKLVAYTGRSKHEVFGLLVHFWMWAESVTADGMIDMPLDSIPAQVGADAEFWNAVVRAGWLEVVDDENIRIPRADHWLSTGAKARLMNTRRKQKGKPRDESATTEENRTEKTSKRSSPVPVTDPGRIGVKGRQSADRQTDTEPETVFRRVSDETLHDRFALREWFDWQSNEQRPVLDANNPDDWEFCLAAAIEAKDGKRSPARFFASVIGRRNRKKIQDKHWRRAKEVAKEMRASA